MTLVKDGLPEGAARWDQYILGHPEATSYHLHGWQAPLAKSLLHTPHYLEAWRHNTLVGVLPLIHLRRPLMGDLLVSLPFVNYGGLLADDEAASRALRDAALTRAKRLGVRELELRQLAPAPALDLPFRSSRVSLMLELPATPELLFKAIGQKLRNQVRKGEKSGLIHSMHGLDGLDAFYEVFLQNMHDLGSPVWPRFFFRRMFEPFEERIRLHVAWHEGKAVAAGFTFRFKQTVEIPWASALRDANTLCANVFLYHAMLKNAVEDGFKVFDFGRSAPDSGTYRFKKQWGAREVPLHWHYWPEQPSSVAKASMGGLETHREKLEHYWQQLPVWSTRLLGPPLRRLLAQ